jgi:hypothetical protein
MKECKQVKWQLKKNAEGLCRQCGRPADGRMHCTDCIIKFRVRNRNYYRIKHGISIDAPLAACGRPSRILIMKEDNK